ncbi:MAG TPA: FMN-binding negative transcriptional regulator [Planctomycetaceae bacterium]|nr:FMN-binding negative transcriptional regulator [Planctomycetaceae bacterium]
MYIPESFHIASVADCHALMREHSFATLVTPVPGCPPGITHLPLIVDPTVGDLGGLRGHLARANPHWRDFTSGDESVVLFQGPHSYISPRWYAAPVAVPTWNYVAVHAHGRPAIVDDPAAIRRHLSELAERYESGPNPWRVAELPDEYFQKMTASIVCFSMTITKLEGKAKLGQNRSTEDLTGVLNALDALNTDAARHLAAITRTNC